MEQIFEELEKLITNARKSIAKKYTKETIQEKLKSIQQLSEKFEKLVGHLANPLRDEKITQFRDLRERAIQLLTEHKGEKLEIEQEVENPKIMSNFDSKKASEIIPVFDGKPKHVNIFLSMIEMVYSELNEQGKNNLIKYVLAIKLVDRVRDILIIENTPETFEELKTVLTKHFKSTRTASSIHFDLKNTKQKGNVLNYKERINTLIADLTLVQISELEDSSNQVARSTIKTMNEKLALEIFQEGLYKDIRTAVIAAQPKTLAQAYDIASTQERSLQLSDTFTTLQINNNKRNYYNNTNRNNSGFRNNRNRNLLNPQMDRNFNINRNNRNYNNINRNFNNNNRNHNRNNNNNRHYNNYNNNYNSYNNNNTSNRGNRYNNNTRGRSYSNVHAVQQQGNVQTLETHYESPNREN